MLGQHAAVTTHRLVAAGTRPNRLATALDTTSGGPVAHVLQLPGHDNTVAKFEQTMADLMKAALPELFPGVMPLP